MQDTHTAPVNSVSERLIAWRRRLHCCPEAGWLEFETSALLAAELDRLGWQLLPAAALIATDALMGYNPEAVAAARTRAEANGADPRWLAWLGDYSGLGALMDSGRPGPTLALRFDIDAVEVSETCAHAHRPNREQFASTRPGLMHACAHDGHMAIGLVLAEQLMARKEALCGRIKLLFQPAEEGCKGAKSFAEGGWLDDVDALVCLHLGINAPSGAVVLDPAEFLCSSKFDLSFHGRSAHAGIDPHLGHNALAAAATAITQLLAIPRHRDGATRVNVGRIRAGEGRNVIPAHALLECETRGTTPALNHYMFEAAQRVARASADLHDVQVACSLQGESTGIVNSPELVNELDHLVRSPTLWQQPTGFDASLEPRPFAASEDASFLIERVQRHKGLGAYICIGADLTAGHHNDAFDFDEQSLLRALNLLELWVTERCVQS